MGQQQISGNPFVIGNQESGNYRYGDMPPEQALQERAIARKQQIMNLLISKGLGNTQQQGQMAGRFYVPSSPVQGLAGLAEMAAGLYGSHTLDEKSQALGLKLLDNFVKLP